MCIPFCLKIPSGAFWGSNDVKKMADLGTLSAMTITMIKHPTSFRVKGPLDELRKQAQNGNEPVVLYEGNFEFDLFSLIYRFRACSNVVSACAK